MDPLKHPTVVAAMVELNAARDRAEAAETAYIIAVYRVTGNLPDTARTLGVSARTVLRRLSAAGIRARDVGPPAAGPKPGGGSSR